LFSFLRKGAHERLRAGCNGGNSWNCFERKLLDCTGTTSRFAANGTEGLPKRPTKRGPEGLLLCGSRKAIEGTGLLDRKAPSLQELSTRVRIWVESAGLASKTRKYYANGWRLLFSTCIVGMLLDHITKDDVEVLRFGGSAANVNCALRTLRRMLHKGEEWNQRERALSYPYGKPGLEQSNHLRTGQQDCRWEKNDPVERSGIRSAPSPRRR